MILSAPPLEIRNRRLIEIELNPSPDTHRSAEFETVDITQPLSTNTQPVGIVAERFQGMDFNRSIVGDGVVAGVGEQR